MPLNERRFPKRQHGFTLIDAMVGVFILAVGSLSLATLMPTMARSQKMAQDMSVATQIASREMEQIKLLGYNSCSYTALRAVNLLDTYSGSGPYKFTNVTLDQASHMTAATSLRNGVGELVINQPSASVREAQVTVRWTSPIGGARSVTVSTLIGKDL